MKTKNIMFQGTGSSVGKSFVTAALCRIFREDGLKVAPFKSQNMALNSFITEEGLEMGRAQVMQAECAGIRPSVEMNPILLKPNTDNGSQVILNGKVWKNLKAQEYYSEKESLKTEISSAYERLSEEYNTIVIEGAGSPAEINLRDKDVVNMGLAELVDSPVVLIADIDKGGVFASLYGTVMLLKPEERTRIKGFIINKFRGDLELLKPGIKQIEELIKIPCLGVIPYTRLTLDDEDSITQASSGNRDLIIGVIRLKHFSNASDFTVFGMYDDIEVEYYDNLRALRKAAPDVLVIPGSKNSIDDMIVLRESGMEAEILRKAREIPVIGICGGYQIMGEKINDPLSIEGRVKEITGMGLLPITSTIGESKRTRQITGKTAGGVGVRGYEIHMGESEKTEDTDPLLYLENGVEDGVRAGRHFGTYLHGLFDSDEFRKSFLRDLGYHSEIEPEYQDFKEEQYDLLASKVRESLDMDLVYKILNRE